MKRIILTALLAVSTFAATACETVPARPEAETWAWCGVDPRDPLAQTKANTLHSVAGIDATLGPCLAVDWSTYTPANPGGRYLDPQGYLYLTVINANAGMKTVVYDARIWSTSASVRQQAIDFWYPHRAWIRAFDMGDEFDPASSDWNILVARWNRVLAYVTPATGIGPYTNNLPWALDEALRDMPAQANHLSYDQYDVPASLAIARQFAPQVGHLMCAINALDHGSFHPTAWGIESAMLDHRDAGCDSFLIFGGEMPINTPGFYGTSLVNSNGTATSWAEAVARGAR